MSSAQLASLRHLASCDIVTRRLSISSVRRLAVSVTSRLPVILPRRHDRKALNHTHGANHQCYCCYACCVFERK